MTCVEKRFVLLTSGDVKEGVNQNYRCFTGCAFFGSWLDKKKDEKRQSFGGAIRSVYTN